MSAWPCGLDSESWFAVSRLVANLLQNYTVIAFTFQLKFISECVVLRFIIAKASVIIVTAVQEQEKHAIRYSAIVAVHSIPRMNVVV
jgi:hypothetical protein